MAKLNMKEIERLISENENDEHTDDTEHTQRVPDCDCAWCEANKVARALRQLKAELKEAKEIVRIFANIEPSSFYSEDGNEVEEYTVILKDKWTGNSTAFTGADLARARAFTKEHSNG